MKFESKKLKNKVEGFSGLINSATHAPVKSLQKLSEVERRIKLKAYRSVNGLYDNIMTGIEILEKRLHQFDTKIAGTTHRGPQLENISKRELYKKAKDLGIAGRSHMNKSDLVEAIRETW